MDYNEAEIEAKKIEEEENLISKVKCAVVHNNTTLVTTIKGNHPRVEITMAMYIDETDDIIIDKSGEKIEKFRVMSYLSKDGKKIENPDYDAVKVTQHDLPGYNMFSKKRNI